jgi:hypothetical protein
MKLITEFSKSVCQLIAPFVDTKPLPSTFVTKMLAPYSTNLTLSPQKRVPWATHFWIPWQK